jgi:hypothetical protein
MAGKEVFSLGSIELYETWNRPDEAAKWRQEYAEAVGLSESN